MPWYRSLRSKLAPTEGAADALLVILALITLGVLAFGDTVLKAAWAIYLVSP